MAPGSALEVPGGDETVNRNITLVPRGGNTGPHKLRWANKNVTGFLIGGMESL